MKFSSWYSLFQHTAARRRLATWLIASAAQTAFQHTAARRRLGAAGASPSVLRSGFQHTAARRRLAKLNGVRVIFQVVSTHSRPKAAGGTVDNDIETFEFQHTAARRRLDLPKVEEMITATVSTHSRPKAAGHAHWIPPTSSRLFQHTAARRRLASGYEWQGMYQCFNTQPPEGGWSLSQKPCSIRFRSPNFAKLPRKAEMRV